MKTHGDQNLWWSYLRHQEKDWIRCIQNGLWGIINVQLKNSKGTSMEPCGTLSLTGSHLEKYCLGLLSIIAVWKLFFKWDTNSLLTQSVIPRKFNFNNKIWLTQSKTFWRSQKTPPTINLLFSNVCHLIVCRWLS